MDKRYDPSKIEQHWYKLWESHGDFSPQDHGEPFCIMIPPPNLTGTLHMGHAFQDTIMDMLARFHRMQGYKTLWQPGTDHAGIATQMVVERKLTEQGKDIHQLGREKFVEHVWKWKDESGGVISEQLRRMGASLDWQSECFTMDPELSKAVTEVFVSLYDEGLIYKGKRLVNWDPVFLTAVSDLEVINTEESGHLWHIRYPLAEEKQHVTVATTRPETMLGDTAVAVHPSDQRYKNLIGKEILLPLCDRKITIIGDDYVDPEFGSGCVKITPAHDFNDYEVGKRHNLAIINIFTPDACLNKNVPKKYQGLTRKNARKQIIKDLENNNFLEKVEEYKHIVPRGDRSNEILEPFLTDQWFMNVQPLAESAIKVVENGKIEFIPENWTKIYFEWMHNIQDWCISRQLWWGHRIPAWYDDDKNIFVAHSESEVRKKYKLSSETNLTQDSDVLDTWFSSALWPFSTLGWPKKTKQLKTFYPSSVLVTGFDIIFFWVARMIMMGVKFLGEVPFHKVYVHGLVRDSAGQKMSKSKGNVLDPLDLIDGADVDTLIKKRTMGLMQPHMSKKIISRTKKEFPEGIPAYGADALRFTFAALASNGRDINFDIQRVEGYRNFCNKLWNASRYVLSNKKLQAIPKNGDTGYTVAESWITARLQETINETHRFFENYRFDLAAHNLYEFIWHDYCDWYVEFSKAIINSESIPAEQKNGTIETLDHVLDAILKLLHPIIPFITEDIFNKMQNTAEKQYMSIQHHAYPEKKSLKADTNVTVKIKWLQDFVISIRKVCAETDISPAKKLPIILVEWDGNDKKLYDEMKLFIHSLIKIDSLTWADADRDIPDSAMTLVGNMKIFIPLEGLIDKKTEINRLMKEIAKIENNLEKSKAKINNSEFVNKAPKDIVQKEKQRVEEMLAAKKQLENQLTVIKKL